VETDYTTDLPVWTVAVWVKSPAAPSSDEPSAPVHREKNFQINWNHPTDTFRGAAAVCIGEVWYDASFGQLLADTWYHLAATYNGQNLKTYKDGALITSSSNPSGNPDAESTSLKLARHATAENYFHGVIDDVRLYNYALSESEIKAICSDKE
jgi:hypothetical protein